MKRTIIYHINAEEDGLTIGQFLKRKKYSGQNLTQLKKREQGILLNSKPAYVIHKLAEGDTLTINILEEEISEKIPPVPMNCSRLCRQHKKGPWCRNIRF